MLSLAKKCQFLNQKSNTHFYNLAKDSNSMLYATQMIRANLMTFYILLSKMEKIEMLSSKQKE